MPHDTYKSAAVPFVNQKGERSMKKVKVERYVAGKRPAYAKEDDEDEYYTTDDEEPMDEEQLSDQEPDDDDDDDNDRVRPKLEDAKPSTSSGYHYEQKAKPKLETACDTVPLNDNDDEEEDDDPRFRRLRQLEKSKPPSNSTSQANEFPVTNRFDNNKRVVVEDDEDEEEIRERHALARSKTIEPIGPQAVLGDLITDQELDSSKLDSNQRPGRETTDDILQGFKPSGIIPKHKKVQDDDQKKKDNLKEMLEKAKEQGTFIAQVHKKLEDDIKVDNEKELLSKGNIGSREMEAVKTDDEDEELAYEEWKLREIKRVLRDRSERALEKA